MSIKPGEVQHMSVTMIAYLEAKFPDGWKFVHAQTLAIISEDCLPDSYDSSVRYCSPDSTHGFADTMGRGFDDDALVPNDGNGPPEDISSSLVAYLDQIKRDSGWREPEYLQYCYEIDEILILDWDRKLDPFSSNTFRQEYDLFLKDIKSLQLRSPNKLRLLWYFDY